MKFSTARSSGYTATPHAVLRTCIDIKGCCWSGWSQVDALEAELNEMRHVVSSPTAGAACGIHRSMSHPPAHLIQ